MYVRVRSYQPFQGIYFWRQEELLSFRAMINVMEFVLIPGGWFDMGSDAGQADERPIHRVWIDPFYMAVFPVTRHDYQDFLDATNRDRPRGWDDSAFGAPDQPVVGVSWNDAVVYCLWRSSYGELVRIPTEAEWERAARGRQTESDFPWGDDIPAWIPNEGRGPLEGPWAVGLGEPNDFGLYGIAANIHEWCADWHSRTYYRESSRRNPTGPPSGERRTSRGGAWRHAVTISRNAARSKLDPSYRYTDYGFRLAR